MIKKIISISALLILTHSPLFAQESDLTRNPDGLPESQRQESPNDVIGSITVNQNTISVFDHFHISFDQVLKKYVREVGSSTRVDYVSLKTNSSELIAYLSEVC